MRHGLPAPAPPGPTAEASAPPAEEAAAPGDASAAYSHAHQLLMNGEYQAAADAYQSFIDTYPQSPTVPAAHYWLGSVKYSPERLQRAAINMLGAIRGWPKTSWAPDAVVKLALSLVQQNKSADACGALGEFSRHYPTATAAAKQRIAAAKAKAGCS